MDGYTAYVVGNGRKKAMVEEIAKMFEQEGIKLETNVLLVCIGGVGKNIGEYMYKEKMRGVKVIHINTDERAVDALVDKVYITGRNITLGKDSGGFPEVAEKCFQFCEADFENDVKNADIVIIIGSPNGGTGAGIMPRAAEIAREHALTACIAVKSFDVEDRPSGEDVVERMKALCKPTIVIDNERIARIAGKMKVEEAFSLVNKLVKKIVERFVNVFEEEYINYVAESVEEGYRRHIEIERISAVPQRGGQEVTTAVECKGGEEIVNVVVDREMESNDGTNDNNDIGGMGLSPSP
ncbi:MAG: hypothetical protein DRN20_06810 [Thermoplasmata archaeon]|nr:MAG: hypothetical protein DRN20_06810 [Thermoplasmata archaeon]